MTLQEVLGKELYEQVKARIDEVNGNEPDKLKHVRYVDLSEGNYISKEKYNATATELDGVKKQLTEANTQIQSFQGQDVDIEKKTAEWEAKYKADTKALQDKLDAQARSHAEEMFLSGYQFTSKAARNGVLEEIRRKQFKIDDAGQILGAKEYIQSLTSDEDYKGAFVSEPSAPEPPQSSEPEPPAPRFSKSMGGAQPAAAGNDNPFMNFGGFNMLRQPPAK